MREIRIGVGHARQSGFEELDDFPQHLGPVDRPRLLSAALRFVDKRQTGTLPDYCADLVVVWVHSNAQ